MGWLLVGATYVILTSLLIFLFVTPKVKYYIKAMIIPIIIWFSIAIFYSAQSFKGYPIDTDPPIGSVIIDVHVVEPPGGNDPEIFLWVLHPSGYELGEAVNPFNPFQTFLYFKSGDPISYKIEYTEERRKKIEEALKKNKENKGSVMIWGGFGEKKGKGNKFSDEKSGIAILNLFDLIKKEGEEN
jgi:hypothetical protein